MAVAIGAAALVILSAPFSQQVFLAVSNRWPGELRALAIAATVVPAAAALVLAATRIRTQRAVRYLLLAFAAGIGGGYVLLNGVSFTEAFHLVEYGLVGLLFHRAVRASDDGSVIWLPLVAGVIAGTADEFFQWFIPIRAGEARDIVLNAVAASCGLLVALAAHPPSRFTLRLGAASRPRMIRWCAAAAVLFVAFFWTVHVGRAVRDAEIGSFLSRYSSTELLDAAADRGGRWKDRPPVTQRWVAREDQYLSEGLWSVQRRNRAWERGDVRTAWRQNRILEKYFVPVLDSPTYAGAGGQRWPDEQRRDAAARLDTSAPPEPGDDYPYPLYLWPPGGG